MSTQEPRIVVTSTDMERLRTLIDTTAGDQAETLDAELLRAEVVDPTQVPPDVVTMNSRVVYRDEDTQETREVTLSYPKDASLEQGRVSVLAPVGAALLGLSVGQEIEWQQPGGKHKRLRIVSVTYQPQAAGHTH
ncbi:nucleoside diphosphate kinase regulator [Vitiosangium sp. GDMCC 1.1324]|uniref:nucleoside diphosphate kinase regulator n=1 Tax=Vitiosangium sp. (strain GDMCC 1.1324) TaxID=2138576 RepID=UPI000D35DF62|nr:nucleoside diphosphate kinase regulator [Vitiosangium sp. GDMCC 1.1324]PTL79281.1 nucleoside diphosphate kinase regulator [Vitiosangium sp. GDMCC 1.1324]